MGWSEILLIGVVALIVVGPKDLPVMFQSLGRMTAKVKRMAREFQHAMEDAANSAGVKDVAKDLNAAMSPTSMGVDKLREAADRFENWDPTKNSEPKEMGPATAKLYAEQEEAKRKIQDTTAKTAGAHSAAAGAEAAFDAAEMADEEPEIEATPEAVAAPPKPKPKAKKKKDAVKKAASKKSTSKKKNVKSKPKTAKPGGTGVS